MPTDHTFLSIRLQRDRRASMTTPDRQALHELLCSIHRAIYGGRPDVAKILAGWAARICRSGEL